MPHLRDGFIVAKVGARSERDNGTTSTSSEAHLSRFAAKMGHPDSRHPDSRHPDSNLPVSHFLTDKRYNPSMPWGLERFQTEGHDHFVTFSCYERRPYLQTHASRDLFEHSLERTRRKYSFDVLAYVVMPEHVHLLLSEPDQKKLSTALQALKVSVSKQSPQGPFWHVRYHDFNVFTNRKQTAKIKYIHRNPVARGLVERPEHWPHSSYLTYLHREQRTVHIAL